MTPLTAHHQLLTEKLVHYIIVYQNCSDKIRHHGVSATNGIYDEAYKDWTNDPSNPLVEPPLGNQDKLAAFFSKCDAICAMKPQTTHDVYKISFGAWAGMQVVQSKVLADMPETGDSTITHATELAFSQYRQQSPDVRVLSRSPSSVVPTLPSHLELVFFPNHVASRPYSGGQIGPHLLGTTVKFRDQETLKVTECTIQDYGTSQLRGDWFDVVYGDTGERRISAQEMNEMLDNSI